LIGYCQLIHFRPFPGILTEIIIKKKTREFVSTSNKQLEGVRKPNNQKKPKGRSKNAKSSIVIFVEKTTIVAERLVFRLKFSEENGGS
jgi:hypothetical protein